MRHDLPPRLCRAVDRAVEADPAARGTMGDLRDALAQIRLAYVSVRSSVAS